MTDEFVGRPTPGSWWMQALGVSVTASVVLLGAPGPFHWSLATALVACAFLPLRYRWPRLIVVVCLPGLVGGLGWPAAMVTLYTLGRFTGRRLPTVPWVAACCGAAVVPVLLTQHLQWPDLVLTVLAASLYSGAPAVLGMLITTREQLQASLRDLSAAREATMAAREEVARAAERDRIGREIHDAVGHHATLIAVSAAALAATSKDEQTRETAERLRVLAKRALAEMRAALGLLGADSELRAGIDALPELVARAKESGMRVELIGADGVGDDIPLGVERTVYRLVQESLTNAAKHAEGAEVEVRLERRPAELCVTVVNGRPPRPPVVLPSGQPGGGLAGLAERIGMMGGQLRAHPTPKGGFAVLGRLPTPPVQREREPEPELLAGHPSGVADERDRAPRPSSDQSPGDKAAVTRTPGDKVGARTPGDKVGAARAPGDRASAARTAADQASGTRAPVVPTRRQGEPPSRRRSRSLRTIVRDTKVASDEETNDGSAVGGARAH